MWFDRNYAQPMTHLQPPLSPSELGALAAGARAVLLGLPESALPLTYQTLAQALGLRPPHTIYRVIQVLEHSMREDAAAGQPFVAALVISRARGGLPAPGFFDLATRLGRHDGSETGPVARDFHARELHAVMNAKTGRE